MFKFEKISGSEGTCLPPVFGLRGASSKKTARGASGELGRAKKYFWFGFSKKSASFPKNVDDSGGKEKGTSGLAFWLGKKNKKWRRETSRWGKTLPPKLKSWNSLCPQIWKLYPMKNLHALCLTISWKGWNSIHCVDINGQSNQKREKRGSTKNWHQKNVGKPLSFHRDHCEMRIPQNDTDFRV